MTTDDKTKPIRFTPRAVQLLEFAERGMSNDQIAKELGLALHTIKVHFVRIFKRLDVHTRSAAVYKWRSQYPIANSLVQLRLAREANHENILALQELVRLQTAAIELAMELELRRTGRTSVKKSSR